jgi:hypothetical protein
MPVFVVPKLQMRPQMLPYQHSNIIFIHYCLLLLKKISFIAEN